MIPRPEQVDAIRRLVRESATAVDALVPTALRSVIPALVQARDELRSDLQSWLATAKNGADRFTAADKQGALRALEGALERVADLQPAMASALAAQRRATGPLAIHNLDNEIRRLSAIFGGGVPTIPNIKAAAILAQGDKLLWKRHETSARRYAGAIGKDIKHLLAVGVAKGETFDQLVNRLRRIDHGGRTARPIDPSADAGDIANGLAGRYRWWAERLVRTEGMNTYNVMHDESIAYANENRPDGDEEYLRRWDSSMDGRVCYECASLDGTVTTMDGTFKGGISAPPLHPCCRCVVLAWLRRWGGMKGETMPKGEVPTPGPARAAPPKPGKEPEAPAGFTAPEGKKVKDGIPERRDIRVKEVYRVPAAEIADRLIALPGGGQDEVRMESIRKAYAKGVKLPPVKLAMTTDGQLYVNDGRHRLLVAIEQGRDVLLTLGKAARGSEVGAVRLVPVIGSGSVKRAIAAIDRLLGRP
ncbi:MAG TPA: phage minor head protein [Xanthobacteraceae bacterium]|nr:phage minor head protein [Xanthobacteraceae bacterium]